MRQNQKSRALYTSPFSKAYWLDAAAEFKDVRILIFAALMIAVRVAMKPLNIHLAPGLQINTAFIANAIACMVIGPVVAIPFAIATDTLGCLLFPTGVYFLPMVLPEIAGSLIFALLLYRAKLSSWRVLLARFLICFLVNVVITTPLMVWYYSIYMDGKTYAWIDSARIVKNLFMFPIETVVLSLILGAIAPITSRFGLSYAGKEAKENLKFKKRDYIVLVVLLVIGIGFVFGYLTNYYKTTSLSASYTTEERIDRNKEMLNHILDEADISPDSTVTIVESAKKELFGKEITYSAAVYSVKDGSEPNDTQWAYSKSKAAKDEALERIGTITIVLGAKDDVLVSKNWQK